MKALYFTEHGGLEVLRCGELPDPVAGPGEVTIRVRACALNRLDLWVRQGWPGLELRFPHVPGSDIAGVIEAVGAGVSASRAAVGDEVVVNPGTSCGLCHACLSGADNLCADYAIVGEHIDGGCADLVRVPAANVCRKPAGLDWAAAAAAPLTFLTAWQMLVDKADVRPGESVLVHAGGSGVGVAAIQIARLHGAQVFTTASTDEKLDRAREIGAHHGIRYDAPDHDRTWSRAVRKANGGRGVDVVVEHTGAATWPGSLRVLRRGGRLVTCGATSGPVAQTDLRLVFYRQLTVYGSTMAGKSRLATIVDHLESGALKPVVARTLPLSLEGARQAHALLADRALFGKVVLQA